MKKSYSAFIVAVLAFGVLLPHARAADGWIERFSKEIDAISEQPSSDEVLLLAELAGKVSEDPERQKVRIRAWERLVSIPDFPDRLVCGIHEEREDWLSGEQTSSSYNTDRARMMAPMKGLRHPGVVRILGEFLSDMESPGGNKTPSDYIPNPPNAFLAASALGQLLESPPVPKPELDWDYSSEQLPTWQLWYAQVKAGNRTFRFKGDPQEYNLQGPVAAAATPAKNGQPARSDPSAAEAGDSPAFPVWALASACGVLGLAIFFLLKNKRRHAA